MDGAIVVVTDTRISYRIRDTTATHMAHMAHMAHMTHMTHMAHMNLIMIRHRP